MPVTIFNKNLAFLVLLFCTSDCLSQHSITSSKVNSASRTNDFNWIFHPSADSSSFGVYHFRKQLNLASKPSHYNVQVSGDNRYQLFVNGKRIMQGPAKGDVAHWRYENVDLAPALKKGKNIIAALIWNEGEYLSWSQISYQAGFMIRGVSPAEQAIDADDSWKVIRDNAYLPPVSKGILSPFEHFQASLYPWGWEKPGYNDSAWLPAKVMERTGTENKASFVRRKMIANTLPHPEETIQYFSEIKRSSVPVIGGDFIKETGSRPITISENDSAFFIIDQGILTTAFPELLLSGGKDATVTITYAEALYDTINKKKGNRNDIAGKVINGNNDVYFPDGNMNCLYRPLYYRTFRYIGLKIKTASNPVTIHRFHSVFTAYPFKENASFKCSDTSLENIWKTGWRTARLCAYETYMDCPYYEQLQYLGDTRIQAMITYAVSGDDRLARNAIEQFSNSMTSEGLTHARYPESRHQTIPPFSLFWICMLNDHWRNKNDLAFIQHYMQGVKSILDWHVRYIDKNGMLGHMPYWNFVDWPAEWPWTGNENTSGIPPGAIDGYSSILTLQYVYALDKACDLFRACNMEKEAVYYSNMAERLRTNTYQLCWDDTRKLMADTPLKDKFSQHANVMGVLASAFPKTATKELIGRVATDSSLTQCTYYYRFYLNQAMKKAGLGNQYVSMLKPWKDMIGLGLTTFAERPEPTRSDCHAWSASPNYDLLATVAGIEPASPGFKTVRIAPNPGPLEWMEGKMPVPGGEITFRFKRNGVTGIIADITLPSEISGIFEWNDKTIKLHAGKQHIEAL